jgi:hypothetical protein
MKYKPHQQRLPDRQNSKKRQLQVLRDRELERESELGAVRTAR